MRTFPIGPILLALLTGLLYTLSLPNFDLPALGWMALIPLHLAVHGQTPRRTFWIGWLAGTAAFAGSMFWVITAMNLYGKVPLLVSVALMLLLSAYLGLYMALYVLALQYLKKEPPSPQPSPSSLVTRYCSQAALGAPFIWVALEWVRTYLFSGLPWSLLGYSQYTWLPVIQIADITAVYGVSFVLVLANAALAEASLWMWERARRKGEGTAAFPWAPVATAIGVVALTLIYGYSQLSKYRDSNAQTTSQGRTLRVGVVQANIDQSVKWDERYRRATQEVYARLTAQASADADLVIWPEAATPFIFEREPEYREEIASLIRSRGTPLVLGSPAVGFYPNRKPYLMNSAYLLSHDGNILGRYSKRHLVPFGEYIPLHGSVLFFLDKLVEGIGDFEAGKEATILSVPDKLPPSSTNPQSPTPKPRFGIVICYEVIFPNEVRDFAARGADFMVTITNDAWFGRSSAPYQHFGMVVLRAVENRVSFARAANTGISGFIDPTGRILEATPIFSEATLTRTIPVSRTPTFYTNYGDVFAYACVIIAAALLAVGMRRWGRGKH